MNINKLFKFYRKGGATVLSMNYNLDKFVQTEEFKNFLVSSGFKVDRLKKKEFVNSRSKTEVTISPRLNSSNTTVLAELAVKTASKKICKGTSFVAAIDCTQAVDRRIAIAF